MARSKSNTRPPKRSSSTSPSSAQAKRPAASNAVSAAAFDHALKATGAAPPFAIAVSGGADSTALMLLASRWCKRNGAVAPLALTVDHGLRKEAAREAELVAHWAKIRGVPHETLVWIGHKPAENIQARAREVRYRLIGERMRAGGQKVLLTGHTRDDQAETFFLRLARGSGLDGLGGMAPLAPFPIEGFEDLQIARPLLGFSHSDLMRTLVQSDQGWIEDPSNENSRFARVQIRRAMTALQEAGLTSERVAAAAAHLRRAREAIDASVAALIARAADVAPWGYALVRAPEFRAAPREVALRALSRLLEAIGGAAYPPRFEQTEATLDWLTANAKPNGRTLGGCRLMRRDANTVLLTREEAALAKEDPAIVIEPGANALWDRRFTIAVPRTAKASVHVSRLGPSGLKAAGKNADLPPVEPRRIAAALPGVWREGRLVAAPLIGFAGDEPAISARFVGFAGT